MSTNLFCKTDIGLDAVATFLQEYPLVAVQAGEQVRIYITGSSHLFDVLVAAEVRGIKRQVTEETKAIGIEMFVMKAAVSCLAINVIGQALGEITVFDYKS